MESEQQIFSENPIEMEVHSEEKLKSAWQLFKEAWSLYRSRFSTWIGILLVPTTLSLLLTGLKYLVMFPPFSYMPSLSVVKIVVWVLFLFLNIIATSALLFSIKSFYGAKESYVAALRNWFPYIFLSVLVFSVFLGGFVFLLIPGVIFLVWFSFALPVFVFEEKRGMEALLRSKQLVSGNFWKVAWRSFFIFLLLVVVSTPFAVVGKYSGDSHGFLFIPLVFITVPMMTFYSWFLYQDLIRIGKVSSMPISNEFGRKKYWFLALIGLPILTGYVLFQGMLLVTHDIPEPDDSDLQLPVLNIPREQNAYFVFSEIGEDEIYWPTDRNLDGMFAGEYWDDALAQEILQKNAHALDVFERGVVLPIFQQPELQDPDRYDVNLKLAPAGYLRSMAYVSLLKAQSFFKNGMEAEAFDQVLKTVEFGQMLEDTQGTLVDYLVGIAIKGKGLETLRSFLRNSHVSSEELLQYGLKLNEYSESKLSMERTEKVEYTTRKHSMERIFDPVFRGEQPIPSEEIISPGARSLLSEREKGFFYYQPNATKQLNIKIFRERIANAKKDTFVEGDTTEAVKARTFINPDFLGTQILKRNAIGKVLVAVDSVSGNGLNKKRFEEKFSVKATQVLLALKAYEQDRGTLPNSLQELIPTYLSEVPQDPFDGKLMRYMPERRILYSTGEDLLDDGGDIDKESWQGGKDLGFIVK